MNVFISHAAGAEPAAAALAESLQAHGHTTLPDFRETAEAGSSWTDDVSQALDKAEAVVVLVGDEVSDAERQEWRLALEASWTDPTLRVVPVTLGDAELPGWLRQIHAVRVDAPGGSVEPGWQEAVLDAIEHPTQRLPGRVDEWKQRLDAVVRHAEDLEAAGS